MSCECFDKMSVMKVILDTNVFVAAGFNKRSSSAKIIEAVRRGKLTLVWNEKTLSETRKIIQQIPPLHWSEFEELFAETGEVKVQTDKNNFSFVEDPDDRKFAALADTAGCPIVTNDDHLLAQRRKFKFEVKTPGEFWRAYEKSKK